MAARPPKPTLHEAFHKDGSLWARGMMQGEVCVGYWEWFRKDGTKLRSGSFDKGAQIGEWITYDAEGKPYKKTVFQPKAPTAKPPEAAAPRPRAGVLAIDAKLSVPLDEFTFTYARSGGPGGQNVNKVNSKAVLRWKVSATPSLPEAVRTRFLALFPTRITTEGELVVSSQRGRDAPGNAQDCLDKVAEMVRAAAFVPKARKATRPSRGAVERRHEAKRHNSERKARRRGPADD